MVSSGFFNGSFLGSLDERFPGCVINSFVRPLRWPLLRLPRRVPLPRPFLQRLRGRPLRRRFLSTLNGSLSASASIFDRFNDGFLDGAFFGSLD